jgi:hypothetical protein
MVFDVGKLHGPVLVLAVSAAIVVAAEGSVSSEFLVWSLTVTLNPDDVPPIAIISYAKTPEVPQLAIHGVYSVVVTDPEVEVAIIVCPTSMGCFSSRLELAHSAAT